MADFDSGYFGMKIGDALSAGAGHISAALQRRYELQRKEQERQEALAREQAAKEQQMRMAFATQGMAYDPTNPAAAFESYAKQMQEKRAMEAEGAKLGQMKTQAEIDALNRRGAEPQKMTPPPGYRFLPDGNLEAIPGGPAFIKQEDVAKKKEEAVQSQKVRNEGVLAQVDEAMGKVGYKTAGFLGNMMSKVGGTSAADLEGLINTIQANLGFERLSQMRAESPTGGALGQVSERELTLLTSAVASLSQKQSPDQLRKNLEKIRTHLTNWQKTVEQAQAGEAPAAPEAAPAGGWDDSKEARYQELLKKRGGK